MARHRGRAARPPGQRHRRGDRGPRQAPPLRRGPPFIGHGIGEQFHTDLQILHYYDPNATTVMRPGMTFTIEPMITLGTWRHVMWDDGWTAVTADGKRTAQFEHTVLVTDDGVDVLTAPRRGQQPTRPSAPPPSSADPGSPPGEQLRGGGAPQAVGARVEATPAPSRSPARRSAGGVAERARRPGDGQGLGRAQLDRAGPSPAPR